MSCTAVTFAEATESIVFLPLIPTSSSLSTTQPLNPPLNSSTSQPLLHSTPLKQRGACPARSICLCL